jgi:type I restriction enzyme M protein
MGMTKNEKETKMLMQNGTTKTTNGSNFFSSGLREKIDRLMNVLWAGGVNNPMDSIEQLSYLVFLRLLSERDDMQAAMDKRYKRIFSGEWAKYAWGNFVTLTGDALFDAVRGAIEKFHELPELSQTGKLLFNRATLKIYERPTLRTVIQAIHEMELSSSNGQDLKGDMYEYLLNKLAQSGTNGQFRTPRHIIDMIVAMVDPQPKDRICDPACGTAGFLISSYTYILQEYTKPVDLVHGIRDGSLLSSAEFKFLEEQAFTGYDNDANMVKIAIMNLYLHKLDKANIEFHNPLTSNKGGSYPGMLYDVILANPPFAGKIQQESILADIGLDARDTELLFVKWFIDHLTVGGRAGVIVPNGVLFGSGKTVKKVREILLTTCELQAVVSLPSGVFKPYSGVGTAVLIFQKKSAVALSEAKSLNPNVWFYELTADGLSLDDKRTPIDANDIPDVLAKWKTKEEGPNSFRVPIERIQENGWNLVVGRYKPLIVSTIKHESSEKILGEILELETKISVRAARLQEALKKK